MTDTPATAARTLTAGQADDVLGWLYDAGLRAEWEPDFRPGRDDPDCFALRVSGHRANGELRHALHAYLGDDGLAMWRSMRQRRERRTCVYFFPGWTCIPGQ